jgi:hypothetical protein
VRDPRLHVGRPDLHDPRSRKNTTHRDDDRQQQRLLVDTSLGQRPDVTDDGQLDRATGVDDQGEQGVDEHRAEHLEPADHEREDDEQHPATTLLAAEQVHRLPDGGQHAGRLRGRRSAASAAAHGTADGCRRACFGCLIWWLTLRAPAPERRTTTCPSSPP